MAGSSSGSDQGLSLTAGCAASTPTEASISQCRGLDLQETPRWSNLHIYQSRRVVRADYKSAVTQPWIGSRCCPACTAESVACVWPELW
jgi:hypothetical protein